MLLVAETTGLDASGITAVSSPPSTPLPRDTRSEPQVDSVKARSVRKDIALSIPVKGTTTSILS